MVEAALKGSSTLDVEMLFEEEDIIVVIEDLVL
jgi:hypothetical protein